MALRFREEHTGCGQPELGRDPAERTKTEERRKRADRVKRDKAETNMRAKGANAASNKRGAGGPEDQDSVLRKL